MTGLENGNFINFEETSHSTDSYKDGQKFEVFDVNYKEGTFMIQGKEEPNMKKTVRWGLAKDDVTPQDIFRMTNEGPEERAIIAKYCIQDCNLVHHLIRKIDVITGYIEMAKLSGASRYEVIVKHALPNAWAPISQVIAINLAYMLIGSVVVEYVFNYQGIGRLMVGSVYNRDLPVVQACALIFASTYVILNLIADLIGIISNPRLLYPK